MNPAAKGDGAQGGVSPVQFDQHHHAVQVAGVRRGEADAAFAHLQAEHVDLLTDDVIHGADDVPAQARPGVDREHRGNVLGVDGRPGADVAAGPLDLGDGQRFVAAQILGGQQQLGVEPAELQRLFVAAAVLVLDAGRGAEVAGGGIGRIGLHVGPSQLGAGHGQVDPDLGLGLEGRLQSDSQPLLLDGLGLPHRLAQIDAIRFLADIEGHDRAVAHPRVQAAEFELIIGQGFGAELQRLQPVVEGKIPLMRGAAQFRPAPFQGLEMMRPQETVLRTSPPVNVA